MQISHGKTKLGSLSSNLIIFGGLIWEASLNKRWMHQGGCWFTVAKRVRLWALGVWFKVLGWFCVQRFKILKPDPWTCLPLESDPASRAVNLEVSALNIYNVFYISRFGSKGTDLGTFWNMFQVCKIFIGLEYEGKDIGFRFIIEYSSLRDFDP